MQYVFFVETGQLCYNVLHLYSRHFESLMNFAIAESLRTINCLNVGLEMLSSKQHKIYSVLGHE